MTEQVDATRDVRLSLMREQLEGVITAMNKQIDAVVATSHEYKCTPYQVMDANGRFLLSDILAAKGNALAALVQLELNARVQNNVFDRRLSERQPNPLFTKYCPRCDVAFSRSTEEDTNNALRQHLLALKDGPLHKGALEEFDNA